MNDTAVCTLAATTVATSLAERINAEHEACMAAANNALDHALRCGELLIEAKAGVGHGQWQRWLTENFQASRRTAQAYMRLAAERDRLAKAQSPALLTIDGALELLSSPRGDDSAAKPDNLIPSPGHDLWIICERSDGRDTLFIMPSNREGFFFISLLRDSGRGERHDSMVEGTKRPIRADAIPFAVRMLGAEHVIRHGERTAHVSGPWPFNVWLHEGGMEGGDDE